MMHDPARAHYPMFYMIESLRILININRYENENVLEYFNRFKQTRDVAKIQLGTELLDTFANNQ